jgi:hypothetical protein
MASATEEAKELIKTSRELIKEAKSSQKNRKNL